VKAAHRSAGLASSLIGSGPMRRATHFDRQIPLLAVVAPRELVAQRDARLIVRALTSRDKAL